MTDQPLDHAEKNAEQRFRVAWQSQILRLYANGFVSTCTPADMTIVLQHNDMPVASVTIPYATAKTLIDEMTNALDKVEKATGQKIKNIAQMRESLEQTKK